jgi:hypothetical protein
MGPDGTVPAVPTVMLRLHRGLRALSSRSAAGTPLTGS